MTTNGQQVSISINDLLLLPDVKEMVDLLPGTIKLYVIPDEYQPPDVYKAVLELYNNRGSFVMFGKSPEAAVVTLMEHLKECLYQRCGDYSCG